MFGQGGPMMRALQQEARKPKNISETLGRLASYFKTYWLALIIILALMLTATWMQVRIPDLVGQTVDCYLTPTAASELNGSTTAISQFVGQLAQGGQVANCWYDANSASYSNAQRIAGLGGLILIVVALYLGSAILSGLTSYIMNWTGAHVLTRLRIQVFEHLHKLSIGYYSQHEAGELMSRITNDAETIQQAFNFALVNVLTGILMLIFVAFTMFTRSWGYALLSLVVSPIMLIATLWFSNQARKAFRVTRVELGNVNAELEQGISAVREVQAFNREKENIINFNKINAANRDANIRAVAFTSALSPTLEALGYLATAIVTCAGGLFILRNQPLLGTAISLGLVITFLGYVQRFNQPIQQISVMWTNIQNAVASTERIFALLDIQPELQDAEGAKEMPPIQGKVEFVNVSAAYKENELVLNGINFTALPGQAIAIVGPTGAGKTTMANLIPRFYDVAGGAVLIDGMDVRNVTARSLRQQIGIVLQDTFLFSNTVMENIRFGRPGANDEEVKEAARLAHADAFIERLPDGYQTVLGERGSGLSQGQRQLLSIARAALADPRILILDEATSSVDTRTERLIQKALEQLLKGRTSFVIAHRLSTIRNADLVLVVDHGEIIECGKHDELMQAQGFYYNLYMSQFRREVPENEAGARLRDPNGNGRLASQTAAKGLAAAD
jgi:ATP-binding cassette, subfamily B, multidrug efflux pump